MPDDTRCEKCYLKNPVWFTANEIWNKTVRGKYNVLCPSCFIKLADKVIPNTGWQLVPENAPQPAAGEGGLSKDLREVIHRLENSIYASTQDSADFETLITAVREGQRKVEEQEDFCREFSLAVFTAAIGGLADAAVVSEGYKGTPKKTLAIVQQLAESNRILQRTISGLQQQLAEQAAWIEKAKTLFEQSGSTDYDGILAESPSTSLASYNRKLVERLADACDVWLGGPSGMSDWLRRAAAEMGKEGK